MEDHSGIPKP